MTEQQHQRARYVAAVWRQQAEHWSRELLTNTRPFSHALAQEIRLKAEESIVQLMVASLRDVWTIEAARVARLLMRLSEADPYITDETDVPRCVLCSAASSVTHKDDCPFREARALRVALSEAADSEPVRHESAAAFLAGFVAHPSKERGWDFDPSTCIASDMAQSAFLAWVTEGQPEAVTCQVCLGVFASLDRWQAHVQTGQCESPEKRPKRKRPAASKRKSGE